jgi:alcohol dehydrogenase, propanol-preferring
MCWGHHLQGDQGRRCPARRNRRDFRVGGLGHLALQCARIAGGFTVAVDIEDTKLAMATELGADRVVNAATTDPVAAIQALGGAYVAVALAASPASFDQAFRPQRRSGRLVWFDRRYP